MSKSYDSLKKLQETREGLYSQALKKAAAHGDVHAKKTWIWKATLAFSILLILAFNVAVFFMMKNYIAKEKKAVKGTSAPKQSSKPRQLKSKKPASANKINSAPAAAAVR